MNVILYNNKIVGNKFIEKNKPSNARAIAIFNQNDIDGEYLPDNLISQNHNNHTLDGKSRIAIAFIDQQNRIINIFKCTSNVEDFISHFLNLFLYNKCSFDMSKEEILESLKNRINSLFITDDINIEYKFDEEDEYSYKVLFSLESHDTLNSNKIDILFTFEKDEEFGYVYKNIIVK